MKRHISVHMQIIPFSRDFYELQLMWQMAKRFRRQVGGRPPGIRIKPKEGLWITYRLRLMGLKKKDMAERLGVCPQTVEQIINGKRSSRRIETALYETLGYPSFEAMIAAARGKGETV
jgi:hypothetical protein